jgi:biopolymer transport protein TolR
MAMSFPGGTRSAVRAEPNVTPMIDVMLVLLIIFMLIVPTLTSGLQATPPAGSNLKPHPEQDTDQILGIDAKGQYFLNRKPIDPGSLGPRLSNIYATRTEDKILYIKADKNLLYGMVQNAMDIAAHNGVRVSAMIMDQRPGTVSKVAGDNLMPQNTGSSAPSDANTESTPEQGGTQ